MEINKIILKTGIGTLAGEASVTVYEKPSDVRKRVAIFYMPNTSWKSMVFNALEHLFSFDKEGYVKDTNKDLGVSVLFSIDGEPYEYASEYSRSYSVTSGDGKEVDWFDDTLRENMGILSWRLEYYGNDRNSLHSLSRFFFLNFAGIKDDEKSNDMPFINSTYDGSSKKYLLAYVLGAQIDNQRFKTITEIEHKKAFVEKHWKKCEKMISESKTAKRIWNSTETLFLNLEDERVMLGDITVAIRELRRLLVENSNLFGTDDEDSLFLGGEINKLERERRGIEDRISSIRNSIKSDAFSEKESLLWKGNMEMKSEEQVNLEKYTAYKEELAKIDWLELDRYSKMEIEPVIADFKTFLDDVYDAFVSRAIEAGLLDKTSLFPRGNIKFNEEPLTITAFFSTSEWIRKAIRVLTFVGLQMFAEQRNAKCLDYSFYDSFIENVDWFHRDVLFDTIFDVARTKGIDVPKMFFFITKIESGVADSSIRRLAERYSEGIDLIESEGLRQFS